METSGLDITKLTIDDIVNAMRINGIKQIEIDTDQSTMKQTDPYSARVTEWFWSVRGILAL